MHNIRSQIIKKILFLLPIVVISLIVLWPSFNLALTGDDYLGLWRYEYYTKGHGIGTWNNFNFLFTDYGPQDSMTALIHHIVGFQSIYYYLASYLLRLFAAVSLFPLVKYLTKNSTAAYLSALFFSVCSTGLETTDWSFNMPSYLAIGFLNIFLFVYLKSKEKNGLKLISLSVLLFYATIISQPIRMTFLPGLVILIEIFSLLYTRNKQAVIYTILRVFLFITTIIFIYLTGYLGNSIGAGETFHDRVNGGYKKMANNFSNLQPYFKDKQYQILAYPIAQFGSLIFPTHLVPPNYQSITQSKAIFKILLPLFIGFILLLIALKKTKPYVHQSIPFALLSLSAAWGLYTLMTFVIQAEIPLNKSQFLTIILGGNVLLLLLFFFLKIYKDKKIAIGIFLSLALIFLSYITFWLRSPTFLLETASRYFIVPAAGVSILLGVLLGSKKQFNHIMYPLFFLLLITHMYASYTFIHHLSTVRSTRLTESIRESIPNVKDFNNQKVPLVFYFEANNIEILHHSLMFGFPVIMGYQYNFFNVWHIAYTESWPEVVAAYTDGSSLKRFSIEEKPVKLENIYSFKLDNSVVINTTQDTRNKLSDIIKQKVK